MSVATAATITGKPSKLADGTWGAVATIRPEDYPEVQDARGFVGKPIEITTRNGDSWTSKITQCETVLELRGQNATILFRTTGRPGTPTTKSKSKSNRYRSISVCGECGARHNGNHAKWCDNII